MVFGLASTTFGTTPVYDEPCECEPGDPCYLAVYSLGSSICGNYETCEIPAACNGDREALGSACACMISETSLEASVVNTESLGTSTQSIPSTFGATDQYVDSTAISGASSIRSREEGADSTASDSGSDSATGSPSATTNTGVKLETSTQSWPATTHSWSAPAGYGISSIKLETKATDSAKTKTDTSLEDVFTTLTETGGSYSSKASYPSYSTETFYTTAVNIYAECPDNVKDCSSGSEGFYTVTETSAISTGIYPITEQKPPMSTNPSYSTKIFYTTELYIVTKCPLSATDCPYGSTTSSTYPVSTIVYRVPKDRPSEPEGYGLPGGSTVYITSTVYSTRHHTVTKYGTGAPSCVCDHFVAENTPETTPLDTFLATETENRLTYSTDRVPDKFNDPTLVKKAGAVLAGSISSKKQPSDVFPNQQPSGTARDAMVTAGASRFGVHVAVAVAGIFAPII
ncbi:hypothetical protein FMUND_6 [Fusarium mundagurra]|uniref:Uncharacterized protein n=1 Tax=Fusarium mundagurra TaxID=1567541 RepID=A0A8H6DPS9_9HYPO|nr:hypothetical protein FMUND_6 [Fusarium mundagurra]